MVGDGSGRVRTVGWRHWQDWSLRTQELHAMGSLVTMKSFCRDYEKQTVYLLQTPLRGTAPCLGLFVPQERVFDHFTLPPPPCAS